MAVALITYPDGQQAEGNRIECANGFVQRCVSDVADRNIPDAETLAKLLNEFFARGGKLITDGFITKMEWPR
jgi:hypothetical protein